MTVTSSLLRHLVVLFRYNAFSGNLSVSCRQHEATTHTGGIGRVAVTTRPSAHRWHDRGVWHCCKNRIQLDQCLEQLCIVLIVCNYKNDLYLPITEGSRSTRLYSGRGASWRRSTAPTAADNKITETAKAIPPERGLHVEVLEVATGCTSFSL